MKVWKKTIAISAVALMAAHAALAGGPKDRGEERFKEADLNKNGVITHEELMAKVKEKFDGFDKNRDGFLTLAELPQEMPLPEHVKERMEKHAERMKERAEKRGEAPEDSDDMPPPPGKGPRGMKEAPSRLQFIARHDKDGDERVSLEEFAERAIDRFKRADANGDGQVTKEEALAAKKHHGAKRFGEPRGEGRRGR